MLGLGVRVYGYGYKSFFIAQNELNLIVVVLLFFTSYKLTFFQFVFAAIYSLVCMIMPIYILVMVKRAEKKLEETSPYIED